MCGCVCVVAVVVEMVELRLVSCICREIGALPQECDILRILASYSAMNAAISHNLNECVPQTASSNFVVLHVTIPCMNGV